MADVFVIGTYSTRFGKWPGRSHAELAQEAAIGAFRDAGSPDVSPLGSVWFSNCGLWIVGQASIRGQACLAKLTDENRVPVGVPIINVEGACASGSLALYGARNELQAGRTELALAIGVEKLCDPEYGSRVSELFAAGADVLSPQRGLDQYRSLGTQLGRVFETADDRTVFMDTYAMQAAWHMQRFNTTQRQMATVAAKNHGNGLKNPRAQYSFDLSVENVLADREISYPLTRSMCAPLSDGAAAVLLSTGKALTSLPPAVRKRAIRLDACELAGGRYRQVEQTSVTRIAAQRAYAAAGCRPEDIDVAEIHDATAYSELYQTEMLGFCAVGEGGLFAERGESAVGGRLPINPSGGLLAKGHPVGATGLSMVHELCLQLRNESENQVANARIALAENGGGQLGFDEAVCAVTILSRPD